jgi:hypothetical protein
LRALLVVVILKKFNPWNPSCFFFSEMLGEQKSLFVDQGLNGLLFSNLSIR